jgi:hypothetical protein
MIFAQQRKQQLGIKSLGDLKREGRVSGGVNSNLFVKGPADFDCLVNRWSRQELLGLIGDSGVGKSEVVLLFAYYILKNNPDSCFIYVSLEMTDEKLAQRWFQMSSEEPSLADRFFIISRYDQNGKSRVVNMDWIKREILTYKNVIGDVVAFAIDHIHVLGENDPSTLNSIMVKLKEMAVELNAFGIPMAQVNKSSGQKGEVPLDSDAVLACSQFKYICSDIIQIHRPILRLEEEAKMSILGWGYCKVREANKLDKVKRGQNKLLLYDPELRNFRKMTTGEYREFKTWYSTLLDMKSAEEKNKAYTYDLQKEVVSPDGRVITITEKFSGDHEEY